MRTMKDWSQAERLIYDAQQQVETLGADTLLTDASVALSKARDAVSKYLVKKSQRYEGPEVIIPSIDIDLLRAHIEFLQISRFNAVKIVYKLICSTPISGAGDVATLLKMLLEHELVHMHMRDHLPELVKAIDHEMRQRIYAFVGGSPARTSWLINIHFDLVALPGAAQDVGHEFKAHPQP